MKSYLTRLTNDIAHHKQISLRFAFAIDTISNVQTICFILATTFNFQHDNQGPLNKFVSSILTYIQEAGSIAPGKQPYFLLGSVGYLLVYASLLILSIILEIYQKKTEREKVLKMFSTLSLLHSRVACSLIICLLTQMMSFQNLCNKTFNDPFVCSQKWLIISCITSAFHIGLALLQEFFFYRVTKNKDAYAVKNNSFHQLALSQKIVTIFLYSLITDSGPRTKIISVISFLMSGLALSVLYKKLPLYNIIILKESMVATTFALSTSVISLLGISGVSQSALEIAWIFLSLLMIKICCACFNQLFNKILQGEYDSPERAIHYILLLKFSQCGYMPPFFFHNKYPFKTLVINGTFIQNSLNAYVTIIKDSKTKEEYQHNVYIQGIVHLEKALERFPKSEVLLLFMAQIYLKKLKNVVKAVSLIKILQNLNLNVWASNSVENLKKRLREVYILDSSDEDDGKDKLELISYFQYRKRANLVKDNVLKEVLKHIEFWEEFKKEQIMITREITSIFDLIAKKQAQEGDYCGDQFANYLVLFSIYLDTIQENAQESKRFIRKFMNLNHSSLGQYLDTYSEREAVVILPVETEGFGRIIDASGSAQGLFNTTKEQIIGGSLNSLLPSVFVTHLFKIVEGSLNTKSNRMKCESVSYGKTKNGTIFEVDIDLRFYTDLEKDIRVIVFFKKRLPAKLTMIVSSSGEILECSDKLQRRLKFSKAGSFKVRLQDILVDYDRVNLLLNGNTPLDEDPTQDIMRNASGSLKSFKTLKVRALDGGDEQKLSALDEIKNYQGDDVTKGRENSNKLCSTYHSDEIKNSNAEKKQYILSFLPLKSSEEKEQFFYNVELKPYIIGEETYKVLTLKKTTHGRFEGLNKESNITLAEVNSTKQEIDASDDEEEEEEEEEDYTSKKKMSKVKWALKLRQSVTKQIPDYQQGSPKSNGVNSPKRDKYHILKSSKSQNLIPQIKRNSDLKQRRRASRAKGKQTERDSTRSSNSSGKILSIKALRNLFDRNSASYSLYKVKFLIIIVVIFMACLGGVNLLLSKNSLEEIDTGVNIVNFAGQRLTESMRAWQLTTRFYVRYLKLRSGSSASLIQSLKTSMYQRSVGVVNRNKELSQGISSRIKSGLIAEIYKKDVSLWDLFQNTSFNNNETDTFVAANLLGSKMLFIGNTSLSYDNPIVINELLYLINNTGNDYLISSERFISVTQDILQSIIQDNISTHEVMLIVEGLSVLVLCLVLIFSARKIFNSYQKLFRSLVKINSSQIEDRVGALQRVKELLSQDIESRQFGFDALHLLKLPPKEVLKPKKENQGRESEPKLNFNGLILYLGKVVGISLLFIQIVTILFIVSLSQSISDFENFEKVNNQLYLTTQAEYRVSMLVSMFYIEIMFYNMTSINIRNDDPTSQITISIDQLVKTNGDLVSAFSETEKDPFIEDLLRQRVCQYLSASIQSTCITASKTGDKETGILDINMKILLLVEYYSNLFYDNPTYNNAKSFVETYATIMRPISDTLEEAYFVLTDYISASFQDKKDSFITRTTNMFLIILADLVISLVVVQWVTIGKLSTLDICRGQILRTVSYKILLENKAMKFYLNKNFIIKIE